LLEIFLNFFVIKTLDPDWILIGIHPKMPDPDLYQINTNPKHCFCNRFSLGGDDHVGPGAELPDRGGQGLCQGQDGGRHL
jgi:hypothetical protein